MHRTPGSETASEGLRFKCDVPSGSLQPLVRPLLVVRLRSYSHRQVMKHGGLKLSLEREEERAARSPSQHKVDRL